MSEQSERIKGIRKSIGMTQQEFSEYTDIPLITIKKWETERSEPPVYLINMLEITVLTERKTAGKRKKNRKFTEYLERLKRENALKDLFIHSACVDWKSSYISANNFVVGEEEKRIDVNYVFYDDYDGEGWYSTDGVGYYPINKTIGCVYSDGTVEYWN